MTATKKHTAYVSFSTKAGSMLALWVDHRPSCDKDQTDPDGWVSGVAGTHYEIERLCELAKAPGAHVVRVHETAAEWWEKIERGRKLAATKARRAALKGAQTLVAIPEEIEREGIEVGTRRTWHKKNVRKSA